MDFLKIQQDIVKNALDWKKRDKYRYGFEGNNVGIVINGDAVIFIPKTRYTLNNDVVFPDKSEMQLRSIMNGEFDAKELNITGVSVIVPGLKNPVIKFLNGDVAIYVRRELIDLFKEDSVHFKGTTPKAPVYVYDSINNIVGIVIPYMIKGEQK